MKLKKLLSLVLAMVMVFSLVACGGTEEPAATETPAATEEAAAEEAPAAEAEANKIGWLAPLSGTGAENTGRPDKEYAASKGA